MRWCVISEVLFSHTHTDTFNPPLLLTSVTMVTRGSEMMALRLVRASVKTGDVRLASKYPSRLLRVCSQQPACGKLRTPDDQKKSRLQFSLLLSSY